MLLLFREAPQSAVFDLDEHLMPRLEGMARGTVFMVIARLLAEDFLAHAGTERRPYRYTMTAFGHATTDRRVQDLVARSGHLRTGLLRLGITVPGPVGSTPDPGTDRENKGATLYRPHRWYGPDGDCL
ncbi:hypothetical protein [Lentzea kentuckyensis]|uniref:hypothetical protein n=1 Tax=Lentzea kentuckyensis TaxID=360086 RepID=UPI000A37F420|nr:hypothetical protein [Lentzea kentuckyensis]